MGSAGDSKLSTKLVSQGSRPKRVDRCSMDPGVLPALDPACKADVSMGPIEASSYEHCIVSRYLSRSVVKSGLGSNGFSSKRVESL
jgi:hypothetical protein